MVPHVLRRGERDARARWATSPSADAKAKVEKFFGDIPSGPTIQRQQQWVAKMAGEKRAMMQDHVPLARIYKTWNIPGSTTRDFTMLDVASDILGSGKNSRLYKRLVYKDQIATSVSVGVGPFEIGSQFQITVTVKPGGDVAPGREGAGRGDGRVPEHRARRRRSSSA